MKLSLVFLVVESRRVFPLEVDQQITVAQLKKILHSDYGIRIKFKIKYLGLSSISLCVELTELKDEEKLDECSIFQNDCIQIFSKNDPTDTSELKPINCLLSGGYNCLQNHLTVIRHL